MTEPRPWMPLYIADWEMDTAHLDCEQDGAYGRLVRWYWRNGPPPDDDGALARILRMDVRRWQKLRPVIAPFFRVGGGKWLHKRVDAERDRASHISVVRSEASGKRQRKTGSNAPSNEQQLDLQTGDQTNINSSAIGDNTRALSRDSSHAEVGEPLTGSPTISTERGRADERAGGSSSRRAGTRRSGEAATSPAPQHVWLGPPEVREAVVRRCGEDFTASYLDPCVWREEHQAVVPKTSVAATRLSQDAGQVLRDKGLKILRTDPVMFPNGVVGEHAA